MAAFAALSLATAGSILLATGIRRLSNDLDPHVIRQEQLIEIIKQTIAKDNVQVPDANASEDKIPKKKKKKKEKKSKTVLPQYFTKTVIPYSMVGVGAMALVVGVFAIGEEMRRGR